MEKSWQVFSSGDGGVNWRKEDGWLVFAESYSEAVSKAKEQQRRGGGMGCLHVERIYEEAIG